MYRIGQLIFAIRIEKAIEISLTRSNRVALRQMVHQTFSIFARNIKFYVFHFSIKTIMLTTFHFPKREHIRNENHTFDIIHYRNK